MHVRSLRVRALASTTATAAAGAVLAMAAVPAHASTRCSATFRVQHDDRIGTLRLPKGNYQVRVENLTCAQASSYFAAFLEDYDGVLPQGWRYKVRGKGRALFTKRGSVAAFAVTRLKRGGGGGRPVTTLTCANLFTVQHDDAIGSLTVPAGQYRLTRLSALSPTCSQIPGLFQSFLDDPDGVLPSGWVVLPGDGAFVQGALSYGFRIEPVA